MKAPFGNDNKRQDEVYGNGKYGGLSTALRFGRDDEFFGLIFGLLLDLILKIDLPLEWMNWSGWI